MHACHIHQRCVSNLMHVLLPCWLQAIWLPIRHEMTGPARGLPVPGVLRERKPQRQRWSCGDIYRELVLSSLDELEGKKPTSNNLAKLFRGHFVAALKKELEGLERGPQQHAKVYRAQVTGALNTPEVQEAMQHVVFVGYRNLNNKEKSMWVHCRVEKLGALAQWGRVIVTAWKERGDAELGQAFSFVPYDDCDMVELHQELDAAIKLY